MQSLEWLVSLEEGESDAVRLQIGVVMFPGQGYVCAIFSAAAHC